MFSHVVAKHFITWKKMGNSLARIGVEKWNPESSTK
jgi:hypothetical protein